MGVGARKRYAGEFKREAVALVREQGYTLVGPRGIWGEPRYAPSVEARTEQLKCLTR